jgi:hypothetical protein
MRQRSRLAALRCEPPASTVRVVTDAAIAPGSYLRRVTRVNERAQASMAELEKMAQLMRHGELRAWPEVGHSPQIERPDEFVDLLIAWTARARRGAWKRALRLVLDRLRGLLRFRSRPRSLPAAS